MMMSAMGVFPFGLVRVNSLCWRPGRAALKLTVGLSRIAWPMVHKLVNEIAGR